MLGELVSCETRDGVLLDGFLVMGQGPSDTCWLVTHGVNDCFHGSELLKSLTRHLANWSGAVLLVNNRGHDISTFNFGAVPMRLGSQYESVHKCVEDFRAWGEFIQSRELRWEGIAAHSLGAIKTAYWLLGGDSTRLDPWEGMLPRKAILVSPPRLTTSVLLTDPKRGQAFSDDLEEAKRLCEAGRYDHVMRIRYPMPNWVSAATFLDKYGSADRYDYLRFLECEAQLPPSGGEYLWLFGEREVRRGGANFLDADLVVREAVERSSCFNHRVEVIGDADHAYRGCETELNNVIDFWLRELQQA